MANVYTNKVVYINFSGSLLLDTNKLIPINMHMEIQFSLFLVGKYYNYNLETYHILYGENKHAFVNKLSHI